MGQGLIKGFFIPVLIGHRKAKFPAHFFDLLADSFWHQALFFCNSGESHGPRLTAIIEGVPAGLPLSEEDINKELKRRQGGYGRGARMKIESDRVEITSGVLHGLTIGGPITLNVTNLDHQKWLEIMNVAQRSKLPTSLPFP